MGAHLITVDSEAKDNFIKQFLNVFASESCFSFVMFIIQMVINIEFQIPLYSNRELCCLAIPALVLYKDLSTVDKNVSFRSVALLRTFRLIDRRAIVLSYNFYSAQKNALVFDFRT